MKKSHFLKLNYLDKYALILFLFVISCNSFSPEPKPSRNLEIGEEVEVATQTIPRGGGTLVVNSPGSEIDGMEIEVPAGSYSGSRTFKITTATITGDKLGKDFNPITPLIQIENGGGYADSIMSVTIPISLPEGHFAMAFYYDEVTGSLEGIPLLELTPTSITFATRHFMPAKDLHFDESTLKGSPVSFNASSNLLVSSISESVLMGKSIISTGFKPGTDDYEFTNYGSYISPGGHCAGQSITMMWYYYERKLNGSPALFSQYDVVEKLWQDNPNYYRFASVIQKDLDWDGFMFKTFLKIEITDDYHYLSWKAFAMSMLVTGHPQFVGLTSLEGGHAILTHKISPSEGILYVTDPNYPGQEKQIKFVNDKFSPYDTKQNANEVDVSAYTGIGYYAVSSMIDWDKITERYPQVLDSTIGNVALNTFPPYQILIKSDGYKPLENGYVSNVDTIRFVVDCPTSERHQDVDGKSLIAFDMYNEWGDLDEKWDNKTFSSLRNLKPGINKIGMYIYSHYNDRKNKDGKHIPYFIDYKWFDVYYSTLKIEPDPIVGEPKEEITITARPMGTAPQKARYVWNFGDGSKTVTVNNDSIVKHKFDKEGSYTVSVELYNSSDNSKVGEASAQAQIGESIWGKLYQCKWIDYRIQTSNTYEFVSSTKTEIRKSSSMRVYGNSNLYFRDQAAPIKWEGNSFRVEYEFLIEAKTQKGEIKGTLSADGKIINSLSASLKISSPYVVEELQDDVRNIPISTWYGNGSVHYGTSEISQGIVVTSKFFRTNFDSSGLAQSTQTKIATDYNEYSNIMVVFRAD